MRILLVFVHFFEKRLHSLSQSNVFMPTIEIQKTTRERGGGGERDRVEESVRRGARWWK